jgi:hypothetical protein
MAKLYTSQLIQVFIKSGSIPRENLAGNKILAMKKLIIATLFTLAIQTINAQDSSKIFFTTGVGFLKPNNKLNNILRPAVAFNSAIELKNKAQWFVQGTLDFNTLKYDQQVLDKESEFLFQNTNSSLLMLGVNGGKTFHLTERWFISGYIGGGFINIGQPRADVVAENVIKQTVVRSSNIFGRTGSRLTYDTRSKLLHSLYVDVNWWASPVKVQNISLNGFGFFVGTRMPM